MKNYHSIKLILLFFVVLGLTTLIIPDANASENKGRVIKGKKQNSVYYLSPDNKRYVFPNFKTYSSWYSDFSVVEEVDDEDLSNYPLGGNVQYRPGIYLVKIQTDPKVYAVGNNGELRWVKSEQIAKRLYGEKWNLLVDDIPDSFFVNYKIGAAINSENDYDPDEEEEENQSIDYNMGYKIYKKVVKKQIDSDLKFCNRIKKSINKIQKRLADRGVFVENLGEEYFDQCVYSSVFEKNQNKFKKNYYNDKKVTICHMPTGDDENAKTISVSRAATKAHIAHGDILGACEDEDEDEDEDNQAPIITSVTKEVNGNIAIISWVTNENSNSRVEYATAPLSSAENKYNTTNNELTKNHSVQLDGLVASTTYYFKVYSSDISGNEAHSAQYTFETGEDNSGTDSTAPFISSINVSFNATSAIITWTTDEKSNSKIEYATKTLTTATTTETKENASLVTSHSIQLNGLTSSTTYYFVVTSVDSSNNSTSSVEMSFTTSKLTDTTAPVISAISANVSTTSATISWTTNEISDSKVIYSLEHLNVATTTMSFSSDDDVTSHSLILNNLISATTYYYRVESKDLNNNLAASTEGTFLTL